MTEYIKREVVTCKNCFHYKVCGSFGFVLDPLHGGVICNDFVNAADAVEVVRCKDCKHASILTQSNKIICHLNNDALFIVEENHFCSYGERKTN